MKKELLSILLGLTLFLFTSHLIAARKPHNEIDITGLVFKEYFYEQPSYGKRPSTDNIVAACMIKLDSSSIEKDLPFDKLHMIIPTRMTNCTTLAGHRVEISGDLNEATTGHQHGDALIDVKSYRIIR